MRVSKVLQALLELHRFVVVEIVLVVIVLRRPIELSLLSIVLPQLLNELGANKVASIRGEHAQDEESIGLEVVVHEMLDEIALEVVQLQIGYLLEAERMLRSLLLVGPEKSLAHDLDATAHVAKPLRWQEAVRPHAQAVDVDDEHEAVPEPDECEDLLVEKVYWQYTLHCVSKKHE